MADADIETETEPEQFEAGDIVRDSMQDERVIVLKQTEAVATEYYLLETQCTVAQCRKNKREWADDPVVEAVYESDVRRVFGDDWFTGDVLMAYDEGTLDDKMTRYRFPSGRLEVIVED